MRYQATIGDRGLLPPALLMLLVMFLMWSCFAVVTLAQLLHLRATTPALVLASDGPYTGTYQYVYAVADQTCSGTASPEPPLPKPGAKIQIHYDPNNICDSMTDNPIVALIVLVIWLVFMSPWLVVMVYWLRKEPE